MKLGLGQRIVVAIEAAVLLVAVLVGVASYAILRYSLIQKIDAQLESVAVLKEYSIQNFLSEVVSDLEALVEKEDVKNSLSGYLSGESGVKKDEIKEVLQNFQEREDAFSSIFVIDMDGTIVASTHDPDEGKDKSSEVYFTQAKKKTFIQDFFFDTSVQESTLIAATPVKTEEGDVVGILAGRIKTDEISRLMIERTGLGKTGETIIVNSSNLVVTDLIKEPGAALKKTIFLPQIETCLSGKSVHNSEVADYHGDLVIGHWHWLPELKSCLVTTIDSREAFESIWQAVKILGIVAVAVGFLGGLFGFLVSKLALIPISKLRDAALKIKEGDFNSKADIDSNDEVGEVAKAFNEMAERLQDLYLGLEKEVKERTEDVNKKLLLIEDQNKTLEDNKTAMINLMEDSKDLEEQLKIEKESVEKKVIERTAELTKAKDEVSKGWLQIQEEKAKLLASIEALSKAFVLVDLNGNVILTNRFLTGLLGAVKGSWTLEMIEGKLGTELDLKKMYGDCVKLKKSFIVRELPFGTKFLKIQISPISMSGKEIIGALILIGDITEEKALARSRDEFFSIASHELRTPLTAIKGNASMIKQFYKESLKDPDLVEMIDDIEESSTRLIDIVNDFLDMGRLEQGKIQFKLETFDLGELVESSLKQYQVTGSRKNLSLNFEKPEEQLPQVYGDKERVRQVLVNLVGNGLKFTEKGGVVVHVDQKDGNACVFITDTGHGIPVANQSLLFRKFQQAGSSLYTRDTTKGTGLGLYISKLMVEGMGGKIWLEKSEEGKGSTFAFCLPQVKSQPTAKKI